MATRNTVQQRIIAEQLELLGDHPTAERVYLAVSRQRPNISKATVYRTLNKMADAGEATRVHVGGGAERFDHRTDPHFHVVCTRCGKVADVDMESGYAETAFVSSGCQTASAASGFVITGHTLLFDGICPACQSTEEKGVQ